MSPHPWKPAARRAVWRVGWTVVAIIAVEAVVCSLAAMPVVWIWSWLIEGGTSAGAVTRITLFSLSAVPSYVAFALGLMVM